MKRIIARVFGDRFFRNSVLFFVASMTVAFLNYLFHPVLARLLSLSDFGDVQALLALFGLLSTFMSGFTVASVHASVNCENKEECSAVIATLRKTAFLLIGIIFTILALGSGLFAKGLRFSSPWLFVMLGGLLVMGALQTFRNGYLQGQGNFKALSIANILVSGGRLIFAATFVWLGFKSFGAILGMLSAQIVSFLFVFSKTKSVLVSHATSLDTKRVREELKTVAFFALSTIFVTVLYNTDIIVVKRFFEPEVAGAYSGISTMANIVFFSTSSFSAVLLSSIKRSHGIKERRAVFLKAIALISMVGGFLALACSLFPNDIIRLLMGERYVSYAYLLPMLVFAFFFASLSNVCVYFALALRKMGLMFVAIFVSFFLVILLSARHDTLIQIAQNYLFIDAFAAICVFAFISRHLFKREATDVICQN